MYDRVSPRSLAWAMRFASAAMLSVGGRMPPSARDSRLSSCEKSVFTNSAYEAHNHQLTEAASSNLQMLSLSASWLQPPRQLLKILILGSLALVASGIRMIRGPTRS